SQPVLGAPADDVDLVLDVDSHRVPQGQRAGHAVDQRHHVDAEAGLQGRELEEVVEHDVGVGVALELDHDLGVDAGRKVVDVADALELAAVHQLGDLGLYHRRTGLVWQLGDDDLHTAAGLLDLGPRPHADRPASRAIRVEDAGAAEDQRPGREVRAFDVLHK